jgi:hypothetical protein
MFAKGIVDHDIYVSFNNVSVIFRKLRLPYFNDRINSYLITFVTIDNKTGPNDTSNVTAGLDRF